MVWTPRVDHGRLLLNWAVVLSLTGACVLVVRRPRPYLRRAVAQERPKTASQSIRSTDAPARTNLEVQQKTPAPPEKCANCTGQWWPSKRAVASSAAQGASHMAHTRFAKGKPIQLVDLDGIIALQGQVPEKWSAGPGVLLSPPKPCSVRFAAVARRGGRAVVRVSTGPTKHLPQALRSIRSQGTPDWAIARRDETEEVRPVVHRIGFALHLTAHETGRSDNSVLP